MGSPIWVNEVPAPITVQDFLRFHAMQFPRLIPPEKWEIIKEAIATVYAIFYGVERIWDIQPAEIWYDKTVTCYRLLVAWYIADMYPTYLSGTPAMGGIPLKRKKIGDVDIGFADTAVSAASGQYQDILSSLKSNPFGHKAYLMIRASGKRVMIRPRTA